MSARCEDFPCCGHEAGDCDGSLYGSDEDIKASVHMAWLTGHGECDHESGVYLCEGPDEDEACEDPDHTCIDCDQMSDGWECSYCGRKCPEGSHQPDPNPEPLDWRFTGGLEMRMEER
jgi:hypothetical protein